MLTTSQTERSELVCDHFSITETSPFDHDDEKKRKIRELATSLPQPQHNRLGSPTSSSPYDLSTDSVLINVLANQ